MSFNPFIAPETLTNPYATELALAKVPRKFENARRHLLHANMKAAMMMLAWQLKFRGLGFGRCLLEKGGGVELGF